MMAKTARVRATIMLAMTALTGVATAAAPPARPWMNKSLSSKQRADLLNARLTLDERISLVHGIAAVPIKGRTVPPGIPLAAGFVPGVARLGIPALYETDASLGVTNPMRFRGADGATALPSGLALAATFNPDLAYAGGKMIGAEARAKGFNVLLAGGVNLTRDPRSGRNFEYLGEDPLLAGTLAGASIRGVQSNHIISTIKHFALNDQETLRHVVNERIEEGAFRESDLLAFEIGIERGQPGSVMCAYNLVGGAQACGNDFLLNRVLKEDWSYPGWVMSDWGAVYATDFAIKGLDQQSGEQIDKQVWFGAPLKAAVQAGTVPAARLRDMTGRILHSMIATGLMDDPLPAQRRPIDYAGNRKVAEEVERQGIVLLRNREGALPLAASAKTILVIGQYADRGMMSGGGSSQVFPPDVTAKQIIELGTGGVTEMAAWRRMVLQGPSPYDSIRARAGGATVSFDDGQYIGAATARAKKADIVIVFASKWMAEGADAPDLTLPNGQDALISAVAAVNPKTIVVLETGGPVVMPWLNQTAGVLEAWYGGAGGGDAVADVLFGRVVPSGRLPMTFPRSAQQLPRMDIAGMSAAPGAHVDADHDEGADVGYRYIAKTGHDPLFPFGFGLSYTQFTYSSLSIQGGRTMSVSFDVANVGDRAGMDVPQAYLTQAGGRKLKRLIGFQKVSLAPGEKKRVTMTVDNRLLANFDTAAHRWSVPAGDYRVAVGASSGDATLEERTTMEAASIQP
ncbi:beta-glucosidase [Sphingomonas sp. BIUV-7]|uniref:Beta-glucosidase n=1 Tax=Sphingomonas natans TaxID=3063330 RepID=A0ABT8Y9R2_9SPHN|nr:beta-glucosidase [Sphingomonas sp. BIUV-7]MDO6414717.1 beta-glucosidase [Sphingomonas sp. BIUV-7]